MRGESLMLAATLVQALVLVLVVLLVLVALQNQVLVSVARADSARVAAAAAAVAVVTKRMMVKRIEVVRKRAALWKKLNLTEEVNLGRAVLLILVSRRLILHRMKVLLLLVRRAEARVVTVASCSLSFRKCLD